MKLETKVTFEILEDEYKTELKSYFSRLWHRLCQAEKFFQSEKYREIQELGKIEQLQKAHEGILEELRKIGDVLSDAEMQLLIDEYEKKEP
jgi:predicted metal-dependent hydrolase